MGRCPVSGWRRCSGPGWSGRADTLFDQNGAGKAQRGARGQSAGRRAIRADSPSAAPGAVVV